MNLKVAHKIIIGFSIILLLTLIASVLYLRILSNVEQATSQIEKSAIPIQKTSSNIQIQLLKQAKQAGFLPYAKDASSLETIFSVFTQQESELIELEKVLTQLLRANQMGQDMKSFKGQYSEFVASVTTMKNFRFNVLQANDNLVQFERQLAEHLDEAGALLVDLSYLEDPDRQADIDRIAGAAGQVEGYLFNLIDSTKVVINLTDIEEVKSSQADIQTALANLDQMLGFLTRLNDVYDTDGLIEQFADEYEKSKALLTQDQNIFSVKLDQLENIQSLEVSLEASELKSQQAINTIDMLLAKVNKNLATVQNELSENVSQGETNTILILVLVLGIGSGIAFATIRTMINPLTRINKVLTSVSQGDLTKTLRDDSDDEYGQLSKNINNVIQYLKELIAEISRNSHELNIAAMQSSQEIKSVTQALGEQKATVEQVTNITAELSDSADVVLGKSSDAESQMSEALGQSDQLKGMAQSTNDRVNSLASMLDETSGLMAELHKESTNIGSILETIQSIADQTNLLALNAAIEAARAGEAGRGFAVVADEVRMLASRTQESTAEINSMIESLQQQTSQAVDEIDLGKNEASDCQQDTHQLLQTLLLINQAIEQMHVMSSDIADSARLQNRLSNDINSSIHDVMEQSSDTSAKSTSTLTYSEMVAELAVKLDKSVDRFKTD
ncbi:methyl-accepting chemotaxis protein [Thalassotalea loyana]|uniref:Methyl-accepting chemotaxis protein n=1 Tax=Thalassotalea loyana TaxID=280483 RepID=A0ABQ6HAN3_9GAMM|nr:methyl-accepting chemotaxis protein [Thalassotalea loyana]GLX84365.1 methyl-accepting chemotaxis protein [Thalassotalea loyana]